MSDKQKDCCGDSSCFIQPAKGMVTNGGCRCKPHQLKREIFSTRKDNDELRELLAMSWAVIQEAGYEDCCAELRDGLDRVL